MTGSAGRIKEDEICPSDLIAAPMGRASISARAERVASAKASAVFVRCPCIPRQWAYNALPVAGSSKPNIRQAFSFVRTMPRASVRRAEPGNRDRLRGRPSSRGPCAGHRRERPRRAQRRAVPCRSDHPRRLVPSGIAKSRARLERRRRSIANGRTPKGRSGSLKIRVDRSHDFRGRTSSGFAKTTLVAAAPWSIPRNAIRLRPEAEWSAYVASRATHELHRPGQNR